MIWAKSRSAAGEPWYVFHTSLGTNKRIFLNQTNAVGTSDDGFWTTAPTSTEFSVAYNGTNKNDGEFIAYVFGSLNGISKAGSFSHTNGSSTDVDCGFSSGSMLVIVKRTDSTGDWYYWDSSRGIVSGNDPYLLINSSAAQNSSYDYIDPLNSGFQIASGFTTGDYIFYAIAS